MHRDAQQLERHLENILAAPVDDGIIEKLVCRPEENARHESNSGKLDLDRGLIGDNWKDRGNRHTEDGSADPLAQVTLMNSRVSRAVAADEDGWSLAGDQIYLDMDLSSENLPAGSRLQVGEAILEISSKPHTGCAKFSARYGPDALRFVNTGRGKEGRFRGANAFVVESGTINVGDRVRKIGPGDG